MIPFRLLGCVARWLGLPARLFGCRAGCVIPFRLLGCRVWGLVYSFQVDGFSCGCVIPFRLLVCLAGVLVCDSFQVVGLCRKGAYHPFQVDELSCGCVWFLSGCWVVSPWARQSFMVFGWSCLCVRVIPLRFLG